MATTSSSRRSKGLESSINKLNLSSPPRKPTTSTSSSSSSKPKSAPPPDSWEDEAASNDIDPHSDTSTPVASGTTTPLGADSAYPGPPPPTPISPSHRRGKSTDWAAFPPTAEPSSSSSASAGGRKQHLQQRPEKTTAAAGRMIAMGLGQKVPKLGEEQRQYERAVREKEGRRIGREREERERERREVEEMRRSVWEE